MPKYRLQKIISAAGICSRRRAEKLLIQERIRINGKVAKLGDQADLEFDKISIDGSPISSNCPYKVFLVNKPIGVISTCEDPQGRVTVLNLIPTQFRKGIYPIGRLDFDSRGALLLTNHGELTLRLTHPRYSHEKTYLVWVKGIPSEQSINSWRNGVLIDKKFTIKASVNLLKTMNTNSLLKVTIREGRNRQIRRIATFLGHPVIDLQRISIAGISLNGLQEGQWRKLKEAEWLPLLTISNSENQF